MKISEIISDNCDLLGDVREAEEKQQHCEDEYIKVPKKALKYRTAGMVAYNVEWLKKHFDLERAVICGVQEPCEDATLKEIFCMECEYKEQELCEDTVSSSENPNKCEDAINRQAAIDAIYARYIGGKEAVDKAPANDQYAEGIDEAVCAVEDLPPVTPQPKDNIKGFYEIAGDLTNGDVIKALFPEVKVEIDGFLVRCVFIEHEFTTTEDWWNAPYKKAESEVEK